MTTIVVPLDGSTFAERALRPACSIAARLDRATMLLVSCSPDDTSAAQQLLEDRASLFREVVDIETRIVDNGDTARTIVEIVEAETDAVVCMATQGRGGLRAAVLGSVSKRVVARSSQPLILVGPNCRTALLPAERGRLLVCSDGSTLSDSVIPAAAAWGDRLQLESWLTEVVGPDEDPEPAHEPHTNREVEAATARLNALAARLHAPEPAAGPARTTVLHGEPGQSIPWFADRLPAALIAMATHGRSGLTGITMGSVANEVVRSAPCPILITRPTEHTTERSTEGERHG